LELSVMVFDNKCVATAVTFSLLVGADVDGCLMSTGLTELSKCNNVWCCLLLPTRARICTIFHSMIRTETVHTAFLVLMNSKHWDGVCLRNVEHWYNRWFALHTRHKNGTVDAICKAKYPFGDRLWLLHCVRGCDREMRECEMQEIDQIRDNADNLREVSPSFCATRKTSQSSQYSVAQPRLLRACIVLLV